MPSERSTPAQRETLVKDPASGALSREMEFQADLDGLFARVVQHELDHLDGVLFIDRMSDAARQDVETELDEFETDFRSRRETGGVPPNHEISARLAEWEQKYC